jgi:hypothetical protein
VDFAKGDEAAHEKTGGDEERERESYFEDDYGAAKFGVTETAAETFADIAEGVVEISAGGFHGGEQAEDERGEGGDAESEEEHGSVEADLRFGGNHALRHESD